DASSCWTRVGGATGVGWKDEAPRPSFHQALDAEFSMPASARLRSLLRIEHPLIGAPMAGGPSTPALAAAISRPGGIGFLGCAYSPPEQNLEWGRGVRARTDRPFGVNLFAEPPEAPAADPGPMQELLRPIHAELGIPPPEPPKASSSSLD